MSDLNDEAEKTDASRRILAQLVSGGEVLSDRRHVLHYFYGGDIDGLRAVLERQGFEVEPTAENPGLVAEKEDVTDEAWVQGTMPLMCSIADEFGAEYDGWEAEAVRQGPQPPAKSSWLSKIFGR